VVALAPAEQILAVVGSAAMKREHMIKLAVGIPVEDVSFGLAVRA